MHVNQTAVAFGVAPRMDAAASEVTFDAMDSCIESKGHRPGGDATIIGKRIDQLFNESTVLTRLLKVVGEARQN